MNIKDIKIGNSYTIQIWDDEEPMSVKCIGKEDGCFILEGEDEEEPLLMVDVDNEFEGLKEVK